VKLALEYLKAASSTLIVGSRNDNPNTTQTLEYNTKDKCNAKIIK
jgi:hypothetical protein